jgi:hypothetical protein
MATMQNVSSVHDVKGGDAPGQPRDRCRLYTAKSPSHKPGLLQAKLKLALANDRPHLLSINGLHEIEASHLPANGGKMRQLPEELQHFWLINRA